jgi:DNA-binding transcriptional MerR regulator
MAKSRKDKLFYKIGEVCEQTGTQPYVLRFWESEFPMLRPQKNRAGQRIYREEDIRLVGRIKRLLYEEEYTIAGARRRLEQEAEGSGTQKAPVRGKAKSTPKPPPEPVRRERLEHSRRSQDEDVENDLEELREHVRELADERAARAREAHMAREEAESLRARLEILERDGADRPYRDLLSTVREQTARLRDDLARLAEALRFEDPTAEPDSADAQENGGEESS